MTYLLSLAPRINPSNHIEWFVLSPFLGGTHSAITRHGNTAFGHRDLEIVWELYAKKLDGHGPNGVDLVSFVKRMSSDLEPVQAVCKLQTHSKTQQTRIYPVPTLICQIPRMSIPSSQPPSTLG